MPNSSQKRKRVRQNEKRRTRNKSRSSEMKTHVKRVLAAVEKGDREGAERELVAAQKRLDKAARHRVIHPNTAARRKSSLARRVAALS